MSAEVGSSSATAARRAARLERWVAAIDWFVLFFARHWLALINLAMALFVGLPIAAPLLMAVGATAPARLIYLVYVPTCHQLPERSYFLGGERLVYTLEELEARGMAVGLTPWERRWFQGDPEIGYKVAFCERDVAIYGSMLLAGLGFALLRRWGRPRALHWRVYLLFLIPLALDGVTQMVGVRESNWWLRTITGALFGAASVWLAYPLVDQAMGDVEQQVVGRAGSPSQWGDSDG